MNLRSPLRSITFTRGIVVRKNYYVRSRVSSDEEEKKEENAVQAKPERVVKGKRFSAVPQYEPECEVC